MQKTYLVTGNWVDKATKKPVSRIAEITGGIGKESKTPYEMADLDSFVTTDGTYAVGTILSGTLSITAQESTGKNPNLKL